MVEKPPTKKKKKKNERKEKKNKIVQVSNIKYLCLLPSSLLSRSLMQQEETFISVLTGLYTECPQYRNTQTYTQDQKAIKSKMLTWPLKNRCFEKSTVQAYKLS